MLDNMVVLQPNGDIDVSMLREAVALINGRFETEASGNVTIEAVDKIGQAGVTFISCGALTHSVKALDISLKIDTELSLEVGKRTNRAYKTIEVWFRILQSLEDKFLCGK